jgi:arsenate reductase
MLLNDGTEPRWKLLILCTGNSARSIMAEAIFNSVGGRHFSAHSAGSQPTGRVNPHALEQLAARGIPLLNQRSKSWLEFTREGAPALDLLLTVCDSAARETCPLFRGDYQRVRWSLPDPAAAAPDKARAAFASCFEEIGLRVARLLELPLAGCDKREMARAMQALETAG